MTRGVQVPKEIKELIINKVKMGERVDEVAKEYMVYPNTIRKWLATEGVSSTNTNGRAGKSVALLLAKAQRDKQDLIRIIGELTVQLSIAGKVPRTTKKKF